MHLPVQYIKDPEAKPFVIGTALAMQLPAGFPRERYPLIAVVSPEQADAYLSMRAGCRVKLPDTVNPIRVDGIQYYRANDLDAVAVDVKSSRAEEVRQQEKILNEYAEISSASVFVSARPNQERVYHTPSVTDVHCEDAVLWYPDEYPVSLQAVSHGFLDTVVLEQREITPRDLEIYAELSDARELHHKPVAIHSCSVARVYCEDAVVLSELEQKPAPEPPIIYELSPTSLQYVVVLKNAVKATQYNLEVDMKKSSADAAEIIKATREKGFAYDKSGVYIPRGLEARVCEGFQQQEWFYRPIALVAKQDAVAYIESFGVKAKREAYDELVIPGVGVFYSKAALDFTVQELLKRRNAEEPQRQATEAEKIAESQRDRRKLHKRREQRRTQGRARTETYTVSASGGSLEVVLEQVADVTPSFMRKQGISQEEIDAIMREYAHKFVTYTGVTDGEVHLLVPTKVKLHQRLNPVIRNRALIPVDRIEDYLIDVRGTLPDDFEILTINNQRYYLKSAVDAYVREEKRRNAKKPQRQATEAEKIAKLQRDRRNLHERREQRRTQRPLFADTNKVDAQEEQVPDEQSEEKEDDEEPEVIKRIKRHPIPRRDFKSIDTAVLEAIKQGEDSTVGAVLCGDIGFEYMVVGAAFPVAEAYMHAVYARLEAGEIPWPLNVRTLQRTQDKDENVGHRKNAEMFRAAYASYDGTVESLLQVYRSVPRLLRGYIGVVAQRLMTARQEHTKELGWFMWEEPIWTEAWRMMHATGKKKYDVLFLPEDIPVPAICALAEGYHNYLTYGKRAFDFMLFKHQRFARKQADNRLKKVRDDGYDDYLSRVQFGLMAALERYDYTQPNKFTTHAIWWIRARVTRMDNEEKLLRQPRYIPEMTIKRNELIKDLILRLGRNPTSEEFMLYAESRGCTPFEIHAMEIAGRKKRLLFLEEQVTDGGRKERTLQDVIADENAENPEDVSSKEFDVSLLHDLVDAAGLTERHRFVLEQRYGKNKTLSQTGEQMGLSRERVRQIEKQALERLRTVARYKGITMNEDDE